MNRPQMVLLADPVTQHDESSRPGATAAARAHWSLYILVAAVTTAVLLYTVVEQIYDTNFYVLWEATALLAGDHPYRDFYQMGWPLLTVISTGVQWLVGYRLIGEFLIHWTFIVASVVLGFHLALRLSRSVAASLTTTVLAIVIIASTPTFQFPKLFFYPVAVLVAWWYMERPGVRRGAIVGLVTAVAFLYRHDHGVYIGLASVLAFVLARVAVPASRRWRAVVADAAAYGFAAGIVVAPWALLVQQNEGLLDYVRTRAEWGRTWAPGRFPYLALTDLNPARVVASFPSQESGFHWLLQITLLLPILMLVSLGFDAAERRRRKQLVSLEICQTVLAAVLAMIVASRLFREDSYFVAVLPLSTAFGAALLAGPRRTLAAGWRVVRGALAIGTLVMTGIAAISCLKPDLFAAGEVEELGSTFRQLVASPPIDAYQPPDTALHLEGGAWNTTDRDEKIRILIRYMHDCTQDGDRLFVTGSTPYQVGYYTGRPIAGGQVQWHHGWRSDPVHEQQSLALLERQSVPFAFSTHDPVLEDLKGYPHIREYMLANYVELDGSDGLLLVDARRKPSGTFGLLGFPCFR